jgi:hypothetical protein
MEDIIKLSIPPDEQGMIGRECLQCARYFKLKLGTGLPTSYCHCPYCEYHGEANNFCTPAQIDYLKSVAANQFLTKVIRPSLHKLFQSFKKLEQSTRYNVIQFNVGIPRDKLYFPIKYYEEEDVETRVSCNSCKLYFAIYGVFARCPDCTEVNAFMVFAKSIEVTQKQFAIFSKPEIPLDVREESLRFVLSSCISAFDGLGKELRRRKPSSYPAHPRNLFQNLILLDNRLDKLISNQHPDFVFLHRMFQVRHLYEHNMGVVDIDFINKVPELTTMLGKRYSLSLEEVANFISSMKELGRIIEADFRRR